MKLLLNLAGIVLLIGLIWLFSYHRRAVSKKLIGKALIIEFMIALVFVKIPAGKRVVGVLSDGITSVISCGQNGLDFVFGSLADSSAVTGSIFAVQVLGNIVFLSALISLLYYIGVLGFVVKWIGKAVGKWMGTSEVESFVAVANMFLGHTESPILVSKYLRRMTDSEIMVVLVSGMGSMSASILGGYLALGIPMEYLLIASTMVPVGGILMAKLLLPETEAVPRIEDVKMDSKGQNTNLIDAIADGAVTGGKVAFSIGATLIAFVAMVALANQILSVFGIELHQVFSYIFAPFGFFLGLDGGDIIIEGTLLGNKLILNEFVAFQQLGEIIGAMDRRTAMIITISLSGFANLSSMGICVSGISVLCPEKRGTLAKLVLRAMLGGMAVSILSALLVSMVMLI